MKALKDVLISLLIALMISYAMVIVFLGFGPVFIDGELAILKANSYTLVTSIVVFWPVYLIRRRRSRRR